MNGKVGRATVMMNHSALITGTSGQILSISPLTSVSDLAISTLFLYSGKIYVLQIQEKRNKIV